MMTGITLLDYRERYSTSEYFKKRAEKTVLPYIIWSLIGIAFRFVISSETVTAKWIINGLLSTGGIIGIYWFFAPLFCVYLCIPLFAVIDRAKKLEIAKYVLISGFFVKILVPFLNSALNLGIEWLYKIDVVSGYIFWVMGVYYIQYRLS